MTSYIIYLFVTSHSVYVWWWRWCVCGDKAYVCVAGLTGWLIGAPAEGRGVDGDGGWRWRWGLGGTSATHQKQQHFPGFAATSSAGPPHSPKSPPPQHITMRTHTCTETRWRNYVISLLTARIVEEERGRGKKHMQRNFNVHQSCMLFVEGGTASAEMADSFTHNLDKYWLWSPFHLWWLKQES